MNLYVIPSYLLILHVYRYIVNILLHTKLVCDIFYFHRPKIFCTHKHAHCTVSNVTMFAE